MMATPLRLDEGAAWPLPIAGGSPSKRAVVDAAALRANTAALRRHVGEQVALMAMVKANGYGHGAVTAARSAVDGGATWLGVSSAEEALQLRTAAIDGRVLVVGWTHHSAHPALVLAGVEMMVLDITAVDSLAAAARSSGRPALVHIKVDTGMGRLGLRPEELAAFLQAITSHAPHVVLSGIFTHFADADGVDPDFTEEQHSRFVIAVEAARRLAPDLTAHCCNSAATLRFPHMHHDMVRPGIAVYGYPPPGAAGVVEVRPALSMLAAVAQVKTVRAGESVGYGRTWRAPSPRRIATIAAGYADGVHRAQSNRGQVVVAGVRCPIVGRVSMDQLTADVTDVPAVAAGDEAVLIGSQGGPDSPDWLGADEVGAAVDTISYEVLCAISARVPRDVIHQP
jgi:alanine racemase